MAHCKNSLSISNDTPSCNKKKNRNMKKIMMGNNKLTNLFFSNGDWFLALSAQVVEVYKSVTLGQLSGFVNEMTSKQ